MVRARHALTPEVRREQIVTAARKVFAAKGYDRTTVADIVAEAGVAQGTFYLYFASKKAIAIELADRYLRKLGGEVIAACDPSRPLAECIRPMVHAAFVWCQENRDLARLIRFTLDVEVAETGQRIQARDELMSAIAEILAQRMTAGEINPMDPKIGARLIHGLVRDACHECYLFGDGRDAQRFEDTAVALLTNALLKKG